MLPAIVHIRDRIGKSILNRREEINTYIIVYQQHERIRQTLISNELIRRIYTIYHRQKSIGIEALA